MPKATASCCPFFITTVLAPGYHRVTRMPGCRDAGMRMGSVSGWAELGWNGVEW